MEKENKQYKVLFIPIGVIADIPSGGKVRADAADFHIDLEFLERVKERDAYRIEIVTDEDKKLVPMYEAVFAFVFNYLKAAVLTGTLDNVKKDIGRFPKLCGGRWDWACVGDSDMALKLGVSYLEKESV